MRAMSPEYKKARNETHIFMQKGLSSMRKTKLAVALLGSAAVLAGCANGTIAGLGLEKTSGFEDHRDDIVVAASIEHADESARGEASGTARVFEDQKGFDNNEFKVDGEAYYVLSKDEAASYNGHSFTITVKADNPQDHVKCEIKTTGVHHPLHTNESEGIGSATCVLTID